jgi:hypothetical protein
MDFGRANVFRVQKSNHRTHLTIDGLLIDDSSRPSKISGQWPARQGAETVLTLKTTYVLTFTA